MTPERRARLIEANEIGLRIETLAEDPAIKAWIAREVSSTASEMIATDDDDKRRALAYRARAFQDLQSTLATLVADGRRARSDLEKAEKRRDRH